MKMNQLKDFRGIKAEFRFFLSFFAVNIRLNMIFTITESQRGKNPTLIKDSRRYCFQHKTADGAVSTWRCIKYPKCKAKLQTQGSIITKDDEHTCIRPHNVVRHKLRVACKQRAEDDLHARPSKVMKLEMRKIENHELNDSDLKDLRCSIYGKRRKNYGPLPKSIEDVHQAMSVNPPITSTGEIMIKYNNSDDNITLRSLRDVFCHRIFDGSQHAAG